MSATTRRRAHNRREQLEGMQRRLAIIKRFHELLRDGHPVTGLQAAIARLSERTLRRALRAPQHPLRHHRFGRAVRIAPDDLAAWLRAHAALPVVSTAVLDMVSPMAHELIQRLDQSPARSAARRGDRTAKAHPTTPANNLRPQPPTRLDCAAESSVHVSTDPRSKEEPIPMHNAPTMAQTRATPARASRGGR
jgi:hypothetical protein